MGQLLMAGHLYSQMHRSCADPTRSEKMDKNSCSTLHRKALHKRRPVAPYSIESFLQLSCSPTGSPSLINIRMPPYRLVLGAVLRRSGSRSDSVHTMTHFTFTFNLAYPTDGSGHIIVLRQLYGSLCCMSKTVIAIHRQSIFTGIYWVM